MRASRGPVARIHGRMATRAARAETPGRTSTRWHRGTSLDSWARGAFDEDTKKAVAATPTDTTRAPWSTWTGQRTHHRNGAQPSTIEPFSATRNAHRSAVGTRRMTRAASARFTGPGR